MSVIGGDIIPGENLDAKAYYVAKHGMWGTALHSLWPMGLRLVRRMPWPLLLFAAFFIAAAFGTRFAIVFAVCVVFARPTLRTEPWSTPPAIDEVPSDWKLAEETDDWLVNPPWEAKDAQPRPVRAEKG